MPDASVANVAHALAVYAEPLAARHRVVVIGDSSLGLDARLVELGARIVHVYDPDPERARASSRNAARGAVIRELPEGELDVRHGAFDLAIVPDLAAVVDRAALLVRIRKLVGTEGAALIAARTRGAEPGDSRTIDYYEMFDLVALQFATVRMIGQVPFAGVAFAELGESAEAPAVSVDTQLAGEGDAPEMTIALVAQHDVRLDPYAIIQLPRDSEDDTDSEEQLQREGAIGLSDHAELAAAMLRAELLQTQVEEQRATLLRLGTDADRAHRVDELEAALHERTGKLKEAETRAGEHYVRAERLSHDVRRLEEDLARHRDRAVRFGKELEDERKNRSRLESELISLRRSPEAPGSQERVTLLEEALHAAEGAGVVLLQRAEESARALHRRESQMAALVSELETTRALPQIDPDLVAAVAARAEAAEARAAMLDAQLAEVGRGHEGELAQLEAMLRERAQAIASAEREVLRREAIVRDLVLALEDAGVGAPVTDPQVHAHASPAAAEAPRIDHDTRAHLDRAVTENAGLRSKLDGLSVEVARREGELQARAWRIAELEERVASLEARPAPAKEPPKPALPLPVDRAELQALRQALSQEHEARVRAESGEELARARADLARQATLLEQMANELENRDRTRSEPPGGGQEADPAQT